MVETYRETTAMTKLTSRPNSSSLSNQLKSILPLLMKVYIPTTLSLLFLVVINFATDIKVSYFTRDPLQIVEAPVFYGIYLASNSPSVLPTFGLRVRAQNQQSWAFNVMTGAKTGKEFGQKRRFWTA